jgi:hypothetical protein
MQTPGYWRHSKIVDNTFTSVIRKSVGELDLQNPSAFPDIRSSKTIVVASDYSGEHAQSHYQVVSFIIASLEGCNTWNAHRKVVRDRILGHRRTMSYKDLRDKVKRRALLPFLSAANLIPDLCVTIAIEKKSGDFFQGAVPLDLNNPQFSVYRKWQPATLKKAFTVSHLIGAFIGGLSSANQNLLWFTDEDEIAANPIRLGELTKIFGWVISDYLPFSLGHIRCGTTKSDDGSKFVEDLASITDLSSGAFADIVAFKKRSGLDWSESVIPIQPGDIKTKSGLIAQWYSEKTKWELKRLLLVVESAFPLSHWQITRLNIGAI